MPLVAEAAATNPVCFQTLAPKLHLHLSHRDEIHALTQMLLHHDMLGP